MEYPQPLPRDRPILRALRTVTRAQSEKETATALPDSGVVGLYADGGHVHRDSTSVACDRRASLHLGFDFPRRHRRNPRILLFADCR